MLSRNIKLNALAVLAALVFALAMVPLRTAQWGTDGRPKGLTDSDVWLRLIRAEQTQKTDSRSARTITRIAPPAGLDLHWTAPADTLLVFGSKLFYPKAEIKSALFEVSRWYPAILFALAVLCVSIIINLLGLPPVAAVFALAVMALNPFMLGLCAPGNVDHHNLQAVLWLALIASVLYGIKTGGRFTFVLGGLITGLGVWVSTQLLPFAALACAAVMLWWFTADEKFRWRPVLFAACAALVIVVAVAVEYPPWKYFTAAYDMVSVVHAALFVFGFCAAVVGGAFLPRIKNLCMRGVFFAVLIFCVAAAMYLFFPGFYAAPIAAYGGENFFAMMGECRCMSFDLFRVSRLFSMCNSGLVPYPSLQLFPA